MINPYDIHAHTPRLFNRFSEWVFNRHQLACLIASLLGGSLVEDTYNTSSTAMQFDVDTRDFGTIEVFVVPDENSVQYVPENTRVIGWDAMYDRPENVN